MRATITTAVAILLPTFVGSVAGMAQEPGAAPVQVREVRFQGVQALEPTLVRESTATTRRRCRSILLAPVCALHGAAWAEERVPLDTAEVRRDEERIRALYAAWGYPNARVSSRVVPRSARQADVHFAIDEGEPRRVRAVQVTGLQGIAGQVRLPEPLPLRPGEPFAPVRADATVRLIGARLAELGHAFAAVQVEEAGAPVDGDVDVVVRITPGPVAVFGRTAVLPGPPIRVADVERRLAYRPGERYRPAALEHTAERLYRVPAVGRVFIDPLPAGDSVVVPTIGVTPRRVQGLQFGGAFSTTSCLEGNVGWGHRYLFGAPRVLTVSGGASNLLGRPLRRFPCFGIGDGEFAEVDYALNTDLQEPLGADTWLLLGGEFSRISSPQAFVRRGVQARIGVRRTFTRQLDGSILYSPERRDQLAAGPLFCALHAVCGEAAIQALAGDATLAPLQLSLGWTPPLARLPPAPPPPGPAWMHPPLPRWLLSGRITAAGAERLTGSQFRFGSVALEGSAVTGRGRATEFAARARVATLIGADEPLPPHVRLFGGGPLGVRGVEVNRLGPKIVTTTPEQLARMGFVPDTTGMQELVVDPRDVRVRPTGGSRLAEVSLEARRWVHPQLQLAAFLDAGAVHSGARPGTLAAVARMESIWTPGVGALVLSPFGPVRGDMAYNPAPARRYPLLVRSAELAEQEPLGVVVYDPFTWDDPSTARRLWRRLQFQLSLGLPF